MRTFCRVLCLVAASTLHQLGVRRLALLCAALCSALALSAPDHAGVSRLIGGRLRNTVHMRRSMLHVKGIDGVQPQPGDQIILFKIQMSGQM